MNLMDQCKQDWAIVGQPMPAGEPFRTFIVKDKPAVDVGAELLIKGLGKEDLTSLTTKGLMIFPVVDTQLGMLEIKSKEFANPKFRPGLRALYCQPVFTPN
jgi:hypothetical protein